MDRISKRIIVDHIKPEHFDEFIKFKDKYLSEIMIENVTFDDVTKCARKNLIKIDECKKDSIFTQFISIVKNLFEEMKKEDLRKIEEKINEKNEDEKRLRSKILDLEEGFVHHLNIFNLY